MHICLTDDGVTTGDHEFAVCPRHTAKNRKHTAKTFADGGRRQSTDGSYRDGEALVCRVSKVAHTANFFAVCIYRRTAKKSEKTPSGLADGVGVCSPCVCTVVSTVNFQTSPCVLGSGTRQISKFRRVPSL